MAAERPPSPVVAKAILPVFDLARAASFFESLGFEVEQYDDGYGFVTFAAEEVLHLRLVPSLDPSTNHASAYLHVADADAWHSHMRRRGVDVGAIESRPWGMREFTVVDGSGNLLRVGSNL